MLSFQTQFILSKAYLAECYDQSLPYGKSQKNKYLFAALCLLAGALIISLVDQQKLIGTLLIALAVLELIHIRFKRAWWLLRQAWGRSTNREISLSITDEALTTQNPFNNTTLLWSDVEDIIETELGLILVAKSGGQQYLSKSLFPEDVLASILAKQASV